MKIKFISSLLLCLAVALFTGCVSTVDGGSKSGFPGVKDSISKRVDRPVDMVLKAARKVLSDSGKVTVEHFDNTSLEAKLSNDITVWVNMKGEDGASTTYVVQARTKWGSQIEISAEVSTRIALELEAMPLDKPAEK